MDVSNAHSVVYAADGSRHKVCWSPVEETAAVNELAAAGDTSVVFSRRARHVTNTLSGDTTGPVFMAGVITGGVTIG